jgi:hypothetical protein
MEKGKPDNASSLAPLLRATYAHRQHRTYYWFRRRSFLDLLNPGHKKVKTKKQHHGIHWVSRISKTNPKPNRRTQSDKNSKSIPAAVVGGGHDRFLFIGALII